MRIFHYFLWPFYSEEKKDLLEKMWVNQDARELSREVFLQVFIQHTAEHTPESAGQRARQAVDAFERWYRKTY